MKPIAKDTNKITRRIKIVVGWLILTIMTPFVMIGNSFTLHGAFGAEYDMCGLKNKLMSYW
jgi:hypothetical protein